MRIKFLITLMLLPAAILFSQGMMHSGNFNPDSLKSITISGKVIADSSSMNGMYYLDTNSDNKPDYILNMGPFWYKPDSSAAVRPNVGDTVTIIGGMYSGMLDYLPMVVVYSINGNFWRSPFDASWNNMGTNSMMGGIGHMGMGYTFGWNHDSIQSINLSGTILVDSTFMYNHFYLDSNNDGKPDYFLNFGPPWYISSAVAKLPSSGSSVSISGWKIGTDYMNMVVVYKINGQVWRDSSDMTNGMGGGWIHKNMSQAQRFYNPFDSTNWMEINPGWNQGGMMGGGGMMPDSLYCQILEVFPQNVPADSNQNTMAAFEVGLFSSNGMNEMNQSGSMGGHMNFNSNVNFQFHFDSLQANGFNIHSGNMKVKYWDNQNSQWVEAANTSVNTSNNTLSASQSEVSSFYIVTSDKSITGIANNKITLPINFSLKQNYPNPFNPGTTIEFSINENSNVNLSIYNILGQKLTTLINQPMSSGLHRVQFNASNLSSGIYFYKLTAGNISKVMKMTLLK